MKEKRDEDKKLAHQQEKHHDCSDSEDESENQDAQKMRKLVKEDFAKIVELVSGESLKLIKQNPDYLLKIQ
jgi:hypothetical protein